MTLQTSCKSNVQHITQFKPFLLLLIGHHLASYWLTKVSPECGAALYREGLVGIHEGFTDGETHTGRALEMDTHKGA